MSDEPTGINPEYARQNPNWKEVGSDAKTIVRDAFAAGWNAGLLRYSGWLLTHGITDIRSGFEEAWQRYKHEKPEG
jgi:hypothetical protein